jgi:hypothetical protein
MVVLSGVIIYDLARKNNRKTAKRSKNEKRKERGPGL